jgi:hypothetical protein
LYATKRARPDTSTTIAFLTTRERSPDKDNWTKLFHLMRYIRGTHTMPMILSANGSGIIKWWVDTSFAVHPNMRGHSGGGLSQGRGFPIVSSTNQKVNTRSFTETKIMGADDFMPAIFWNWYFRKAQGYGVKDNVLFQDDNSSILLEKNGKASSSNHMKHINIWYFFIADRIKKNEVLVVWCPTGDMIGDFATNPLEGDLFRKLRNHIMGVNPAREPLPVKTDISVGKKESCKNKPKKGKSIHLVPPGKEAAPQDCVWSQIRNRAKLGPGRAEKIADLEILNQSRGKSVLPACAACVKQVKHSNKNTSFTSLPKDNPVRQQQFYKFHTS